LRNIYEAWRHFSLKIRNYSAPNEAHLAIAMK
jgi:hypothetical protein